MKISGRFRQPVIRVAHILLAAISKEGMFDILLPISVELTKLSYVGKRQLSTKTLNSLVSQEWLWIKNR